MQNGTLFLILFGTMLVVAFGISAIAQRKFNQTGIKWFLSTIAIDVIGTLITFSYVLHALEVEGERAATFGMTVGMISTTAFGAICILTALFTLPAKPHDRVSGKNWQVIAAGIGGFVLGCLATFSSVLIFDGNTTNVMPERLVTSLAEPAKTTCNVTRAIVNQIQPGRTSLEDANRMIGCEPQIGSRWGNSSSVGMSVSWRDGRKYISATVGNGRIVQVSSDGL